MMKRVAGFIWLLAAIALLCCCAGNPSAADPPGELRRGNNDIRATEDITDIRAQDEEEDNENPDDVDDKKDPADKEGSTKDYTIRPGNVLSIDGGHFAIINKPVQVDDKGYIKLIHIGRVKVAGKTKWEAEDFLTAKFEEYFVDPQITLDILNLKYFIGGEVKMPGQKVLQGDVTLTQAIQVAGGGTSWANMKKVTVKRLGKDGKSEVKTYNCEKINNGEARDPYLRPDDQVNVPR